MKIFRGMSTSVQILTAVTLLISMFYYGFAYYSDHKFSHAYNTRSEVHQTESKIQKPEFRQTRVRTEYYELEKFASDESYGGKSVKRRFKSPDGRKGVPLHSFQQRRDCPPCDDPQDELCCRKTLKNAESQWPPNIDYGNEEIMNDVHIHPMGEGNDLLCQKGIKDFSRGAARRKPKDKLNVLIIGDETMDFLSGTIYRGKCRVSTESYPGLTVTDARQRMRDVSAKDLKPDKMIVHAGANDIIDELPSVTALVISKLKTLVDDMRNFQESGSAAKSYALSGIIPRNDPLMTFNNKVNLINSNVGWYATSISL